MKTSRPKPYQTSPIARKRRTPEQMASLLDAIKTILDGEDEQITIRHLFYRLVGVSIDQGGHHE